MTLDIGYPKAPNGRRFELPKRTILRGDIVTVTGENAVGKTTLLKFL